MIPVNFVLFQINMVPNNKEITKEINDALNILKKTKKEQI